MTSHTLSGTLFLTGTIGNVLDLSLRGWLIAIAIAFAGLIAHTVLWRP